MLESQFESELNDKNASTNHVLPKNVSRQCPSSANKISENSVNEREISVMNTILEIKKNFKQHT